MLIKFSDNPWRTTRGIFAYNKTNFIIFILLNTAVAVSVIEFEITELQLSVIPVSILGGALAIFLGFRNNSAYDMWWEGRKVWGGVVNVSRTWGMEVMSFVNNQFTKEPVPVEERDEVQKDLVNRHLAWINALRLQLRDQDNWEELKPYLGEEEFEYLKTDRNRATMLLHRQGLALEKAAKAGLIDDFRHMELVQKLRDMYDLQGKAERIKKTVFPYYYSFFTHLFLWLFVILIPFSLVKELGWMIIPIGTAISFVFIMLEKSGRVTEDPFENRAADVPLSSLCRTIEIDMKQQLRSDEIPENLSPLKTRFDAHYHL